MPAVKPEEGVAFDEIELRFTGNYALAASIELAASASFVTAPPGRDGDAGIRVFDLGIALERGWKAVGVRISQREGRVHAQLVCNPERAAPEDVSAQLERMLCLDVDGAGFDAVGARDAVVGRLQGRHRGVRPVLFPSPYEAAARAIIGHRLAVRQAAAITARIAEEHGAPVDFGHRVLRIFPPPHRLANLPTMQGLSDRKIAQLRALGTAATEGRLASGRLRAMSRDEASSQLQLLAGIGPFSAELILLRGVGDPDAFPRTELRLHRAMMAAYQLGEGQDIDTLEKIAEGWRPYRSWVGLLMRNFIVDI